MLSLPVCAHFVRVFDKKEASEIFDVSLETADKILATFVESHQMYHPRIFFKIIL